MALEFILKENVLTDNILILSSKGKVFKGGYIGFIKEYSYQNPWSDKEEVKRFKSKQRLLDYLDKKYPEFDCDLTETELIN